jgi:predicted DsbA family dithiol-disulfide isomerase
MVYLGMSWGQTMDTAADARAAHVDMVADLACPWCYLGLVRFERARRGRPVALRWRPFLLNPHLPPDGMDRASYLAQKFGGREAAARIYARIEAAGQSEGIRFAFERIERTPNTMAAHRLILAAERLGRGEALMHVLFRALFEHGRDVGRADVLAAAGHEAGLADDTIRAAIEDDADTAAVVASHGAAARAGIGGVPVFIFNAEHAIAGAQPPEVLEGLIDLALATGDG